MDSFRYYLALLVVILTPGAFIFWFSVHPFIRFWRKVGAGWTWALHFSFMALVAAVLYRQRHWLLSVQFGTNPVLVSLAVPAYVGALILARKRRARLKFSVMMGLPELSPDDHGSSLLTSGIYAHLRHPRYVELLLFLGAHALLANYLAVYITLILSLLAVLVVVFLEERELRDRFGPAYDAYCRQVPRFFPKRR